jgi:GH43 family beta-xylosidase
MPKTSEGKPEKFINPVYPHSFPDPFVLKFRGQYFGYCTGDAEDGNVFAIIRSANLVRWEAIGSAMMPLSSRPPYYWAPEVFYDNGRFYLYYSAGNETLMEIRVAVSDRPDGGFEDAGVRLTGEDFAIDAHVFVDNDGQRYLFYATDFLDHSHVGTGTVVDRMLDWKTLAGTPRPVTRARYDWQVYDPARKEKGGVRWHTVEGPTVLTRKGKYFEMFSGGNWQNNTYGVSFAVADSMQFTDEWRQFSDGEKILPILRTIPGKVVGPGHNSVVRGSNNRELYCVYHRWTDDGRVLAIDRMDFAGDRLFVAGPTTTEQPGPFQPIRDLAAVDLQSSKGWSAVRDDELISTAIDGSELVFSTSGPFLLECTFRFANIVEGAEPGLTFRSGHEGPPIQIVPSVGGGSANIKTGTGDVLELPNFNPSVDHLLRIESGLGSLNVRIDNIGNSVSVSKSADSGDLLIDTRDAIVSISAIELTPGFEEQFTGSSEIPDFFDVRAGICQIDNSMLTVGTDRDGAAEVDFDIAYPSFELAVNLGLKRVNGDGRYGLKLTGPGSVTARLSADAARRKMVFSSEQDRIEIDLPEAFEGTEIRQYRLVKQGSRLTAHLDGILLGDLASDGDFYRAAVYAHSELIVDAVRVTEI